jgi:arginyl-tRNA synthetase
VKESIGDILRSAIREAALKTGLVVETALPPVIVEVPREREHGDFSTNIAMLMAGGGGAASEGVVPGGAIHGGAVADGEAGATAAGETGSVPSGRAGATAAGGAGSIPARTTRRSAVAIAEAIAARIDRAAAKLDKVEVQAPGFINMHLSHAYLEDNARYVITEGERYGRSDFGEGSTVQVEFVSANPTGPLNVVSARAAAVGDSLVRLLRACGYDARSEFFVNDSGTQVELLGLSLKARVEELLGKEAARIPDEGYHGQYLVDLAKEIPRERALEMLGEHKGERPAARDAKGEGPSTERVGSRAVGSKPAESAGARSFIEFALEKMHEAQKKDLAEFGVSFDRWFKESSLHTSGYVEETFTRLKSAGFVYERDGANWFKSSELGDDQDRVLKKSPSDPSEPAGEPTYFLSDIAYHRDKFERGFSKVIDIWGPDHHGHVPRMKAASRALGYPEDWLEVLIVQWVRLMRGRTPISMSKRAGEFITLVDLIKEVGVDCARFFFLMRRLNSHLDFDLDLAKKQSEENPVYYVQYAHARVSSIIGFATEGGIGLCGLEEADLSLLKEPEEVALLKLLVSYPEVVRAACLAREPQRITTYLTSLATALHQFYHNHRVVGVETGLMQARLVLVRSVKIVLKNGLGLIGVSAPEKM